MIDLHCHLLPGIDDGPRDVAESLELAQALVAEGVHTVVATPHLRSDHPGVLPAELADRCRELGKHLSGQGIELRIVPGGEVDVAWALDASEEDLRLVSFDQAGADLLIETPYGPLPPGLEDFLFKLKLAGFRLTLAHPERNHTLQSDPARLARLVEQGLLVQVTAGSLGSGKRSPTGRLAARLLQDGLAHVLASDSHGVGRYHRIPLSEGLAEARALVGARADWLVNGAPAAIVAGESLPPAPASGPRPAGGGLLRRLLGSGR